MGAIVAAGAVPTVCSRPQPAAKPASSIATTQIFRAVIVRISFCSLVAKGASALRFRWCPRKAIECNRFCSWRKKFAISK